MATFKLSKHISLTCIIRLSALIMLLIGTVLAIRTALFAPFSNVYCKGSYEGDIGLWKSCILWYNATPLATLDNNNTTLIGCHFSAHRDASGLFLSAQALSMIAVLACIIASVLLLLYVCPRDEAVHSTQLGLAWMTILAGVFLSVGLGVLSGVVSRANIILPTFCSAHRNIPRCSMPEVVIPLTRHFLIWPCAFVIGSGLLLLMGHRLNNADVDSTNMAIATKLSDKYATRDSSGSTKISMSTVRTQHFFTRKISTNLRKDIHITSALPNVF